MTLARNDRTLPPENYIEFYHGRILFDDVCCMMTRADWERLADYSATFPTGKSVGKVWRATAHPAEGFDGTFCMYDECDPPEEDGRLLKRWPVIVVD